MDEFPGLLARDFGFRPQQGKSAPMSASKPSSSSIGSGSNPTRSATANPLSSFDDVFGGPPKYSKPSPNQNPPALDSIFDGFKDANPNPSPNARWSSMPVYDKPVYDDDDIFEGVPGTKNAAKVEYDDVFATISKGGHVEESGGYDDLLGGLGRSASSRAAESKRSDDLGGFEDLIPGFGGSSPPSRRDRLDTNPQTSSVPSAKPSATMPEDPFVVLEATSGSVYPSSGMFTDPLEHLGRPMNSGSMNVDASPASREIFDDMDAFDGLAKSVPSFTHDKNATQESGPKGTSVESFDNVIPKGQSTKSFDSRSTVQSPQPNDGPYERIATADQPPKSSEHLETVDDVWLTVSEIPLFTQPTSAPPPSRLPPPLVIKSAPYGKTDPRRKDSDSYSQSSPGYLYSKGWRKPSAYTIDEFENFVMNKPQSNEHTDILSSEDDVETNSAAAASAAAMKEAMDKAEAKFKHAKEVREREQDVRSARIREFTQERDEEVALNTKEWEDKRKQETIDLERLRMEKEKREREQRRLEREREEREKARQAVERATREARERAAAEARERAATEARAKAEREAVEKVNAEARRRAERAAVQRAQQEARERAAVEARLKAERVAAEVKEKIARERERAAADRATAEARQRAERAAVDKANAQARERAVADAREKQNKNENDLESFFATNRATSAPKERFQENQNPFEAQPQNRSSTNGIRQPTSTSSNTVRKTTATPNIVDDLSSIFGGIGAPLPSGVFKEVEGEPEERRRSRLEKHQRTLERAAKALAEKNERDMQVQREQAERHRIAETLDAEIKRWAAGKEGNLRALLSTLQYVLWPECGWQAVSLTDLIEASKVKIFYRKATLCIHPDKVQQKGANIQQKYIAEKVFDLLKEAWNKFNSEELF